MLERLFHLEAHGTTPLTEVRAGVATYLTMAYILFVNPQILAQAGLPAEDVTIATAVASAVATLVMGLYANYPFALAPGMGLNAYFTFGVVQGMGVPWPVALAAVFVEGVLFLALAAGGLRTAVVNAIPDNLKRATTGGIGLFLALIGFQNAGLSADHPATLLTLGDLHRPALWLALGVLALMGVLLARKVRGALLLGIVAGTLAAWLTGLSPGPTAFFTVPSFPRTTFLALDFGPLLSGKLLIVVLAFLFVDFFDTAGTLMGVGRLGGFLDEQGALPRAGRAFTADALGTTVGAVMGTSTVTSYIESATGIEEGGRTGLTAVVVATLFLTALFFTPVFVAVPAAATAPALILVGVFMMRSLADLDWGRLDDAVPAFLTVAAMPFTYSIANGIALGLVATAVIKPLAGRGREVPALVHVLAALLALYYALAAGQN